MTFKTIDRRTSTNPPPPPALVDARPVTTEFGAGYMLRFEDGHELVTNIVSDEVHHLIWCNGHVFSSGPCTTLVEEWEDPDTGAPCQVWEGPWMCPGPHMPPRHVDDIGTLLEDRRLGYAPRGLEAVGFCPPIRPTGYYVGAGARTRAHDAAERAARYWSPPLGGS